MIEQILTSSILILAVCLLRVLFEKRISSGMKYALWLLVAVKLLIPLPDFKTNLSVMNVVNQLEKSDVSYWSVEKISESAETTETALPIETDNSAKAAERTTEALEEAEAANSTEETERTTGTAKLAEKTGAVGDIKVVLRVIWLIGAGAIIAAFVWANLKFSLGLRKNRQYKETYHELKVYRISQQISPCLYGIRPAIYISGKFEISDEKLMYILAHEYTHYRHGDHIWALIRCICVILYWYNPFVWLAAMLSVKDGELACDEGTIKWIGEENRLDYGKTLIETIKITGTKNNRIHVLNCSTGMDGGIKDMQKRIKFIAKKPGVKKSAMALMAALCVALIGCTFGRAEEMPEKEKQGNTAGMKDIFGTDFTHVKDYFQWSGDEPQKQELPESYQTNELQGYSVELKNVVLLGKEASRVYLQFLGDSPETAGLTLLYAEYPEDENMDLIVDTLTDVFGKNRQQMYCSWPGRVYWMDRWAGTGFDSADSYQQKETDEKMLWGSERTVADVLEQYENSKDTYESWQLYSRIYEQSLKNDWEQVKTEPLVTGVLFKNSDEYKTPNTVILDGFNLCMSEIFKTKELPGAAQMEGQDDIEPENSLESGLSYGNVILQEEPSADKVSIQIDPSMLRERVSYYYIPEEEEQEKLSAWMKGIEEKLEEELEVFDRRWSGRKEAGWSIWYHGRVYTAFEDGYFYYQTTSEESLDVLEYCRQNEDLYQFVSGMMEKLGYRTTDISQIKDIVSAKLEIQGIRADYKEEIRTITDKKILSEFEKWFSEAEYMYGGADCANNDACLTLTLADGKNVKLSLATDGCPIFAVNGVYYNYTPEKYRINGGWNNDELFQYFDENF